MPKKNQSRPRNPVPTSTAALFRQAGHGSLSIAAPHRGILLPVSLAQCFVRTSPIVNAASRNYPVDSVTLDVNSGIYLVHAKKALLVSAICTHLGCHDRVEAELGIIACPCHAANFMF